MNKKIKSPFFVFLLVFLICNPVFSISGQEYNPKPYPVMQNTQDTLNVHQYGEKIAKLLSESNWPAILEEIHAIRMPEGWEEMIKPSFESYFGKELKVRVIPFDSLPDYQLKWLLKAPREILEKTTHAIRLSYDQSTPDETNKGKLELAIYTNDGDYSILSVGNQ